MLYILMWIIHVIWEESRPTSTITEEERLAYLKERERISKKQEKERQELIREAGLDPNNLEDVLYWETQRDSENRRKWADEVNKQYQNTFHKSDLDLDSSSCSSGSDSYREWSDDEYKSYLERESNKGPVEKLFDFLFWTG